MATVNGYTKGKTTKTISFTDYDWQQDSEQSLLEIALMKAGEDIHSIFGYRFLAFPEKNYAEIVLNTD